MKNIVVPIDFSSGSKKALDYAFTLADRGGSRIKVYHIHSKVSEQDEVEELKEEMWSFCQEIRDRLEVHEVYYEVELIHGNSIMSLNDPEYLSTADLVIMGTKGVSGEGSALVGSNTVNLMNKVKKPMLIVPDQAEMSALKHILFCTDYKYTDLDFSLKPIKDMAVMLGADIVLGHIKTHKGQPNPDHVVESKLEGDYFKPEVETHYQLIKAENVFDGISYFLEDNDAIHMVAMINRQHGFFDRLFRMNNTQKMAYHTTLPLLVLPE